MPDLNPLGELVRFIRRSAKRVAVTVVGLALLVAGAAMLVLPGPGLLVIIAGLAVLATEYVWAEKMLDRAKAQAAKAGKAVRNRRQRGRREPPP